MIFKAPRYKFCLFGCFCFYWKMMNVAYIFIYICLHLLLWYIPVCLSVIFFSLIFIYGHIYLYVSTLCSWFTVFFNSIYYSLYCTAAEPWPDGVTLYQQYQGEVYIIAFFNDTYAFFIHAEIVFKYFSNCSSIFLFYMKWGIYTCP